MRNQIIPVLVLVIAVASGACKSSAPLPAGAAANDRAALNKSPARASVLRIAAELPAGVDGDAAAEAELVLRVRELVGPPPTAPATRPATGAGREGVVVGATAIERPSDCEVRHVTEFVVPPGRSFVARGTRNALSIALSGEVVPMPDGKYRGRLTYEETAPMHVVANATTWEFTPGVEATIMGTGAAARDGRWTYYTYTLEK